MRLTLRSLDNLALQLQIYLCDFSSCLFKRQALFFFHVCSGLGWAGGRGGHAFIYCGVLGKNKENSAQVFNQLLVKRHLASLLLWMPRSQQQDTCISVIVHLVQERRRRWATRRSPNGTTIRMKERLLLKIVRISVFLSSTLKVCTSLVARGLFWINSVGRVWRLRLSGIHWCLTTINASGWISIQLHYDWRQCFECVKSGTRRGPKWSCGHIR